MLVYYNPTWSNLSYVIFGIWMIYDASRRQAKKGKTGSRTLKTIGVASIMVGVTSGIYHATYTAHGQFLDFVGMYMFAVIPVILNLRRLRFLTRKTENIAGFLVILLLSVFTALVQLEIIFPNGGFPIQNLVAIMIFITVIQEIVLWYRSVITNRGHFIRSLVFIGAGFACSISDATGLWCDPKNHFVQGHAVWHVLGGISLQFLYLFYAQFDLESDPMLPLVKNV